MEKIFYLQENEAYLSPLEYNFMNKYLTIKENKAIQGHSKRRKYLNVQGLRNPTILWGYTKDTFAQAKFLLPFSGGDPCFFTHFYLNSSFLGAISLPSFLKNRVGPEEVLAHLNGQPKL